MRSGDTVKHGPSGETWTVAYVDGDMLAWSGWPVGEAKVSDCTLIESCSDAEHIKMLRQLEGYTPDRSYDRRPARARAELEKIASGLTEHGGRSVHFQKLAKECAEAASDLARAYAIYVEDGDRLRRLETAKRLAWIELLDAAFPPVGDYSPASTGKSLPASADAPDLKSSASQSRS